MRSEEIQPSYGLHTICATFHQIGIPQLFLRSSIGEKILVNILVCNSAWFADTTGRKKFPECMGQYFTARNKR